MPEEKIELFNLLQDIDRLHCGSDDEKSEGFRLLRENEEKVQKHDVQTIFLNIDVHKFSMVCECPCMSFS